MATYKEEFFFTIYRPYQGAFGPVLYTINPHTYKPIESVEEARELAYERKAEVIDEPGGPVTVTWGSRQTWSDDE